MNPINQSIQFLKSSYSELLKVTFPTTNQLVQRTIIVIAIMIVATALIGLFDAGVAQLLKLVLFK